MEEKIGEFNLNELENIYQFLNKKILAILFLENGMSVISLFKKIDGIISYHYLQLALNELKDIGAINFEKRGREIKMSLTEKGEKIKEKLMELIREINKQ